METFTVEHDGVALHVTRGGQGRRPLVLCPGLNVSQAELDGLISLLRRDFDVTTFDLRGHGLSSRGEYSFDGFLADLTAVMTAVMTAAELPSPILMGYSLGADLAVHYAAGHPGGVGSLMLVDGGNPLPEPFITEEYLPEFREIFADPSTWEAVEAARGTDRQLLLTPEDVLAVNMEVDAVRLEILERYRAIEVPITLVTSTWIAGEDGPERHNTLWQAGWARLAASRPDIAVTRLATDHGLVFSHAEEIATVVSGSVSR